MVIHNVIFIEIDLWVCEWSWLFNKDFSAKCDEPLW